MVQKFEMLQKQTQQMILSPQMLQAIHMLQMPLMELQELVQQEITLNPVLEEEKMDMEKPSTETTEEKPKTEEHESELDFKEEFNNLTKLDDEWKDYFAQSGTYRKFTQQDEEKRRFMLESVTTGESLHDHLLWQLGLVITDPNKKNLGEIIIGNIDENGYLRTSSVDLASESGKSVEEIEEILSIIQTFNPVGVGAQDIKECLLIQLERLGKVNTLETKIVENYLDLVAEHKYKPIADALQTSESAVQSAVELIITLDPKPGLLFSQEKTQYIEPDVFVEKIDGEYVVTQNDARIPHLFISNLYRDLMQRPDTTQETKEYIRNKVLAGNWLIRNILQRQQTINKIATEIVRVQREFLEDGPSVLRPLTMQEVASAVGLHESTISRAIANKYIQTPQGTFQLKYFFSSGVQTESGESISIATLKEKIGEMIKKEDSAHPFSDQDIIEKLTAQGIKIARRTIAKYRHEMGISASSLRKKAV